MVLVRHFFTVRRKYSKSLMNVRFNSLRGISSRLYVWGRNSRICLQTVMYRWNVPLARLCPTFFANSALCCSKSFSKVSCLIPIPR